MNPAIANVLQYFSYSHLPNHLQLVSEPFHTLAVSIATRAPNNPETTVALRKLLESKDAAVRAALTVLPTSDETKDTPSVNQDYIAIQG